MEDCAPDILSGSPCESLAEPGTCLFCRTTSRRHPVCRIPMNHDLEKAIHSDADRHALSTSSSLIHELQQFDQERWRTFVRVYAPLLLFWIRKHNIQQSQQEDLLQECLISISGGIQRFAREENKGTFRGWLRTIVQRRVADYLRSELMVPCLQSASLANIPSRVQSSHRLDGEEQAFQDLRARAMELARQSCNENTWQMFWQTVVEGTATADVAKQFHVSSAAVRMARGRVLNLLRQLLVEETELPSG